MLVVVCIFFILFFGLVSDVGDNPVYFLSFRLIISQLLVEYFFEPLEGPVVGESTLVFGNLLPSCFYIWHSPFIESIYIAVYHHWKVCSCDWLALVNLWTSVTHNLTLQNIYPFNKFPPQAVVRQLIEPLEVIFIVDGLYERKTFAIRKVCYDRFFYFVWLGRFGIFIIEAVLQILRWWNLFLPLILNFKHKVTQQP